MVETPHPWQSGPAELIAFALEQSHKQGELNQRIAFLLLDVSVETLFKTFLVLPDSVTSTGLSHYERKKAAEGNFHELCDGIKKAASKRLEGIDLTHIQYYHDLRNKLYHQGNGINVGKVDVRNYAKLSVNLLQRLLEVDLFDELNQPLVDRGTAPSKERRKGKSSKSGQTRNEIYQQFFAILLARFKQERPRATSASKPFTQNWFWFSAGRQGYFLGWMFRRNQQLCVEFYVDTLDARANKKSFAKLEQRRDEIESRIGKTLDWNLLPEYRQSRVGTCVKSSITDSDAELNTAQDWALDMMIKFYDTFHPLVREV